MGENKEQKHVFKNNRENTGKHYFSKIGHLWRSCRRRTSNNFFFSEFQKLKKRQKLLKFLVCNIVKSELGVKIVCIILGKSRHKTFKARKCFSAS